MRANHPETSTNLINTLTFCTHTHTHTFMSERMSDDRGFVRADDPHSVPLEVRITREKQKGTKMSRERAVSFEQTYEGVIQVINIVFIDV